MFEFQKSVSNPTNPKSPPCPMCASEMALKKIHRQEPQDHFIFRCPSCAIEYPVVGAKRD